MPNNSLERTPRAGLLIEGFGQEGWVFGCKMEGGPLSSKALGMPSCERRALGCVSDRVDQDVADPTRGWIR